MPQWDERQRLTIDNLLETFSADTFKKITSGQVVLAISRKDGGSFFHPCDVKELDTARYWAVYDHGSKYISEAVSKQGAKFSCFYINLHGCLNLLQQATDSPVAFDVLSGNAGYNPRVRQHNIAMREKLIASLTDNPQPLIALAHAMVLAEDETLAKFIRFLFGFANSSLFSTILTKKHETQSVLYALLSSSSVCSMLSESQFFMLVDAAYQQEKKPLPQIYIDRITGFSSSRDQLNRTFIAAARCGDVAMLRQLLAVSATTRLVDADYVDMIDGGTVLHSALRASLSDDFIHELIAQTKDLNHCDHEGYSPIALAFKMGRSAVVDMLLAYESVTATLLSITPLSKTVLHAAVVSDDNDMINSALAIPGIDAIVDYPDPHGDTALSLAVRARKLGHVQLLMAHGAHVHSSNVEGASPMSYASRQPKMLALLQGSESVVGALPPMKKEPELEVSDLDLRKAQVISILHAQMQADKAYTVDVPVVRKRLDEACGHIAKAETLPAVHRELMALQHEEAVLTDQKGITSTHSFLRQDTMARLQYYGFLSQVTLPGLRARAIQWRDSVYSLFYTRPSVVPLESPVPAVSVVAEPSAPPKPNDVAAAGAGVKAMGCKS
ncbi:MAG: hypothetical protein P1U34_06325 [Coxiellaceae bacterium]|nr:hypothetical protein [Coxiellaceae bacterium]